jgi:hypothetical protein
MPDVRALPDVLAGREPGVVAMQLLDNQRYPQTQRQRLYCDHEIGANTMKHKIISIALAFTFLAYPTFGGMSGFSPVVSVVTEAASVPASPATPTAVTALTIGSTSIGVSWNPGTQASTNTAVKFYLLWMSAVDQNHYVTVYSNSATSFTATGLLPSTTYFFTVQAGDGLP